jgi:cytochrome c oxidase subunit I
MTSTDHKVIGNLYMVTSFAFFAIAGLMALVIRAELARPGLQFVSNEQYNQLFTMHGTLMLFLFATPCSQVLQTQLCRCKSDLQTLLSHV